MIQILTKKRSARYALAFLINALVLNGFFLSESLAQGAFIEENGRLLIQMESFPITSRWARKTDGNVIFYEAQSGSTSNPLLSGSMISVQVKINQAGIYRIEWRNKANFGTDNREHNDSWLRFVSNSDVTFFAHKGASESVMNTDLANKINVLFPKGSGLETTTTTPVGTSASGFFKVYANTLSWNWIANTNDFDPYRIYVKFNQPGTYTMNVSARSIYHAIDKIAMYRVATYGSNISNKATLDGWAESPREGTVSNQPPAVNAGTDKAVTLPTNSTTLTGTAVDSDGSVNFVQWSQLTGPNAAFINSPNTLSTSVSNLVQGTYTFQFRATDDDGASSTDVVNVVVNGATASTQSVVSFTLINAATDQPVPGFDPIPNGAVINLSQTGNQLNIRANTNPSIIGSVVMNMTGSNGGSNHSRTESGAPYSLFGDSGGNYAAWSPAPQAGFAYSLTGTPFTASGGTGTAGTPLTINFSFTNTVSNQPPNVNAGTDQSITLPVSSTTLAGTATDADGTVSFVQWSQLTGPSLAFINSPNQFSTSLSGLQQGTYTFEFRATDDDGANASDVVQVTVNPAPVGGGADFWLEAECASVGGNWQAVSDNAASGGAYLLPAVGNNNTSPSSDPSDYVTFTVNVSDAGAYKVFALVRFPTSNDDSFWVRANGGSWVQWNGALGTGSGFGWRQVHINSNRSNLLSLNLVAGANTIQFARREDGSGLDKIYLTKSGSLPTGMGETAANCGSSARFSNGELLKAIAPLFDVYPNPASGFLSIEAVVGEQQAADLEIISLTGQTVYRASFEESYAGQLPISSYAKGLYLVRIKTANAIFQKKVLFE